MFVELRAGLYLVEWDDNVLEEDDVFVSKRNGESTDDAGKDIKKFSSTVEFVSLVNKSEEALIDCLSNHLSSWDKLCVQLVKDIFEIVSFDRFFRVKELKEFLDELWSDVNFERSDFDSFVDDKLKEEFVDTLQVRPSWLNFVLSFNTSFRELQIRLLEVRKWSENVLLNHSHDIVQEWDYQTDNSFLVLKELLNFVDSV